MFYFRIKKKTTNKNKITSISDNFFLILSYGVEESNFNLFLSHQANIWNQATESEKITSIVWKSSNLISKVSRKVENNLNLLEKK